MTWWQIILAIVGAIVVGDSISEMLLRWVRRHSPRNACVTCGLEFATARQVVEHLRQVHVSGDLARNVHVMLTYPRRKSMGGD